MHHPNASLPTRSKFFDIKMISLSLLMFAFAGGMMIYGPHPTLDAKFYYSGEEARGLIGSMDPETLGHYYLNELCDLCFIVVYTASLLLSFKRLQAPKHLMLVAIAPGLFDLMETTTIIYTIQHRGPATYLDYLGAVTNLKWTLTLMALATLLSLVRKQFQAARF